VNKSIEFAEIKDASLNDGAAYMMSVGTAFRDVAIAAEVDGEMKPWHIAGINAAVSARSM
jgi:hypothetical protein